MVTPLRTLRGFLGRLRRAVRSRLRPPPPPADDHMVRRARIAAEYVQGAGIEVGALHKPLPVPANVDVTYIDRMRVPELRRHYPELANARLVEVDIVDDGELLRTIPDGSQDFVIASHYIEHCGDPIEALTNHFRVLKTAGILYLAVPDKRLTFDKDRPVTPIAHIYEDHEHGADRSREQHYEEWVRVVGKVTGDDAIREHMKSLMEREYSIHFHVWTQLDFLEFLLSLRDRLHFDIETMLKQEDEIVIVLRKTAPAAVFVPNDREI